MHPSHDDDPDVLLQVPHLRVEEITLEVDDLEARVALDADVLELLKLHVGVDALLGRVALTIKGVEAEVLLRARLDNVARIIDRVLTTIDQNPQIVERLVEHVGTAASRAVGDIGAGAGAALDDVGHGVDTVAAGLGGQPAARASRRRNGSKGGH